MWTILAVVLLVGLWLGVASAIWGFGVATAGIYGRGEARKQIQSAPFRIEAYQYFFNQCASIQGMEGKIDALVSQLSQLEPGTRDYSYTLSSLTGVKGLRSEAIAKYNQDALKEYTEGQFRDSDLPYQLPNSEYPSSNPGKLMDGGATTCAVR
jgi:hypothetical protein